MANSEGTTRGLASGIYGLVVAGATLAAAAATNSIVRVAIGVLGTVFIYWVAEGYAHALARRMVLQRPLRRVEFRAVFAQGWGLISATYLPLLGLVVAGLLGADTELAIDVALIVVTVLLGLIGWTAGRRSGVTGWRLVVSVGISLAMGLVMVGLKRLLH